MRQIKRQDFVYTLLVIGVLVFMIASLITMIMQERKIELLEAEVSQLNVKTVELQNKYDNSLSSINTSIVTIEENLEQIREKK